MYYADLQVLRRVMVITQICEHYAELKGTRRFNGITHARQPAAAAGPQQTHASPAGSGGGSSEATPPAATSGQATLWHVPGIRFD